MNNLHPHRKKSLLYLVALLFMLAVSIISGLLSRGIDQNSQYGTFLSKLIALPAIYLIIFTIPFGIYVVKYWRAKSNASNIPTVEPDTSLHEIRVQYTTNLFAKLSGMFISKVGVLSWNNANKTISLKTENKDAAITVFESQFNAVQKFESNINMVTIKLNGKSYTVTPFSGGMAALSAAGAIEGDQLATIAVGAMQFDSAGIPGLAEALRQENVAVTYTSVTGAIEKGFVVGYVLAIAVLIFALSIN